MSRLHGSRVESAMRPLPRFRSCSIDITAHRQAVTEQLDTPTAAEAEDDRVVGASSKHSSFATRASALASKRDDHRVQQELPLRVDSDPTFIEPATSPSGGLRAYRGRLEKDRSSRHSRRSRASA